MNGSAHARLVALEADETQPPATETAPDAIRCAPVLSAAHVSVAGSTSESRAANLLAHLGDVSRLREARMAELERVRALRGAK